MGSLLKDVIRYFIKSNINKIVNVVISEILK